MNSFKGNKKQLVLSVSYKLSVSGSYRLQLDSIEFNNLAGMPNITYLATPSSEFRNGNVNIIN